jgi:peptide/nickel transport system permease protein
MKPLPDSLGPHRLAWRRLRRNRVAVCAGIVLVAMYLLALFAGFFSPYSPTSDEFRDKFFHPPIALRFTDPSGGFSLRPWIARTYLVDQAGLRYASVEPAKVLLQAPEANLNPFLANTLEGSEPAITVYDDRGRVLQAITSMQETGPNTGLFVALLAPDRRRMQGVRTLTIRSAGGEQTAVPVRSNTPPAQRPAGRIYLTDLKNHVISAYSVKEEKYPVRFFVHGWRYRLLWLIESDIHLFGVESPAQIFLLGTDQAGRDIFSRLLYGARISLSVGLVGVLITTLFGLLVGSVAGFYGGAVDNLLMRVAELLISVPALYLILTLRNTIPDRMQESYDKIGRIVEETFAWQADPLVYAAVLIPTASLLTWWYFRSRGRVRLAVGLAGFALLLFGRQIAHLGLHTIQTVLPGSTHLTSDWTYLIIIAILSTVGWAGMSRVIRGMVLSLREQEYVQAARAAGASDIRIIVRHILPNTLGYVVVRATLLIPAFILGEVALSYLGVGVQEPTASWGNMLSAAQNVRVLQQFTWSLAPGFLIFTTVLAYNFLGDALRDAFDPRQQM